MKILYYDCFAGISGDMNLGAMLDLGVDQKYLLKELSSLPIDSYKIKVYKDKRGGITGTKVDVIVPPQKKTSSQHTLNKQTFGGISRMIKQSDLSANVKRSALIFLRALPRRKEKSTDIKLMMCTFMK